MVLPALVLFVAFLVVPLVAGVSASFTDYAGYGDADFVGLDNYIALFKDPQVAQAYLFTIGMALVCTVLVNVVSLFLAILLNVHTPARGFFRALFFVPKVLPMIVIAFVFNFIFSKAATGLLEQVTGESASSILSDPNLAWIAIVVVTIWQASAFTTVIYLAGLQTIPEEIYEAAQIDGAGAWRRFRSMTLPLIGPFLTINIVLSIKDFLQIFDQIVGLTDGGPGTSTQSVAMLIYRGGIGGSEYGYQMANAVIYLLVILLFSGAYLRFSSRKAATL
ncbi:sugar ABC transporter permease [Microbacterium sp. Y-01]|uniref:carbohydrate ABC transporter permease n=1 Tax=Microbacterium sp. Y-01 TaxID=2048898 RepID=UPI000F5FFCF0|nr:sugar ABC transporter permease [Microbacterium sp. Y-01]AZH79316.1 sugar ABC transporter permease [Microbacterium sp. Y-01]